VIDDVGLEPSKLLVDGISRRFRLLLHYRYRAVAIVLAPILDIRLALRGVEQQGSAKRSACRSPAFLELRDFLSDQL